MAPTAPRLLPHQVSTEPSRPGRAHAGATTAPQHPSDGHRPPGRWRHCLDALRKRRAHPAALALAACCALSPTLMTACADDTPTPQVSGTLPTQFMATTPDAGSTPTPTSASAPPSLSPELTAQRATALAMPRPIKPTQASQNDAVGATNAVAYFFELYRYAFVTGDTTDFQAMSEEGCVFCQSTIDNATELHQNGGWANPWDISLPHVSYIEPGPGKEYSGIEATISTGESTTVYGDGQVKTSEGTSEETVRMAVRFYDQGWHIQEVAIVP